MPSSVSNVVLNGLLVLLMMTAVTHGDEPQTSPSQASVVNTSSFTNSVQAEARLEEVLGERTSLYAIQSPLIDIIPLLADKHNVRIIVDQEWMEAAQPDLEVPVTIDAKGFTLRSALDLMLPPLGMSYIIRDEAIQITSIENAKTYQYVRVYKLPGFTEGKESRIVDYLLKSISPNQWTQNGGEYSASAGDGLLTINANREVHTASMMTLERMRRMHEIRSSNEPRLRGDITAPQKDPFAK
ncbi:hypothetical protein [Stieleria varia]|uniref:Secretin/TonB short N-terminal domain-containing protein n=1 Tax=Stieleria varia TaxID=2528005 RepID=A0A5C6ASU4_9BACT|nr:hypothetical protein [Stieleria varia]TWU02497.1 hypothetical protein Pla52n_35470 [Stieleria varia]